MPNDAALDIGLLSPERTPVFDVVAETARSLFNCEQALVSIIDEPGDRQYFKAGAGPVTPLTRSRQTPLSHSLCKTVVAHNAPLMVNDGRRDIRFSAHPAVAELGVVAYLGVPIGGEAEKPLGALCVVDNKARAWDSRDVRLLRSLGEGLSSQIGQMIDMRSLGRAVEPRDICASRSDSCAEFALVQRPDGTENVEAVSDGFADLWEIPSEDFNARRGGLFAFAQPEDLVRARASMGCAAASLAPWQHVWRIVTASGRKKQLHGTGLPQVLPGGGLLWQIVVRDVTKS